jgi:hypothetical protein
MASAKLMAINTRLEYDRRTDASAGGVSSISLRIPTIRIPLCPTPGALPIQPAKSGPNYYTYLFATI